MIEVAARPGRRDIGVLQPHEDVRDIKNIDLAIEVGVTRCSKADGAGRVSVGDPSDPAECADRADARHCPDDARPDAGLPVP